LMSIDNKYNHIIKFFLELNTLLKINW
jgi:hypothetical protein